MPFLGIGLHAIIAIFFAVHAIRSGQPMYWLFVLFAFPLLGSLVYFAAVFLPASRLERGAQRAMTVAARALNPTRELRAARAEFDRAPTAQNRLGLARALLDGGHPRDAAVNFENALDGLYADDPEIRYSAARAWIEAGEAPAAAVHLQSLHQKHPNFRPEAVSLLLAQARAQSGEIDAARADFESIHSRYGSFNSLVEYAIFSLNQGDREVANRLRAEIQRSMSGWSRANRDLNRPLLRRLKQAEQQAR